MTAILAEPDEVPPGWASARLGELLPLNYGKALNAQLRNSGVVPVYGSSGVVGFHSEALVDEPSLIVGRKGAAGAIHLSKEPCYPIDTVYFTASADLDLMFCYNLLTHCNLERLDQSTAVPSLSRDIYNAIMVSFPPFAEQRRIVERIEELFSELDAGVESLRRARRLLERYRQSVLQAAVTGELTKAWRARRPAGGETGRDLLARILEERRRKWEEAEIAKLRKKGKEPKDNRWKAAYRAPAAPDTAGLPELPEGWVWATLPQIGSIDRGKSKHRPRNDPSLFGGSYPFIQTGVVRAGGGRIKTFTQTYNDMGLAQSRIWPVGTMCVTIAANIAETGILEIEACFPDSVVGFVSDADVNVSFVELFMRTIRSDLERYAPATAQRNINLETLAEVAVPVPSTEEQTEIADAAEVILSNVEATNRELDVEERRAAALRQAILAAAFRGELVPQDPDDEPASVLLERIRAERAASPVSRRRRRAPAAPLG